ncbi:PAS_9 domain-containing protein [Cephalotus follicularis]|uniref:PAS_9 domain-containing protein n=1 Tax=Cephalotus follicularis TaxID=3775 RepID=A0A1Q3CR00_CEPFO|nr:PAS_9 domain-containing protein [Cephalotus follicularis]
MEPQQQLGLNMIEQSFNNRYSNWVREALEELPDNFTITDPGISGHPIVFASRGFLKMSGYAKEEVVGRNGRIFQGPQTNRGSVLQIREAIREEKAVEVNLLNYRKDGTPFWMLFRMSPVFGREDGKVSHFVAAQIPISRPSRRNVCGFSLCEDVVFGSCRREVSSDSLVDPGWFLPLDSDYRGFEIEEQCQASDLEKRRAMNAINNILSVLTHYSELTGRLVCAKRCCVPVAGFVNSSLNISLGRIKQSFVLTDPHLSDMPIVYASDSFLRLTGYDRHEVLGHNCRFLSGVDTDSTTLYKVKESIRTEKSCTVHILNYRKDKSSFWNLLHISPVRNASGKIAYFVGVQIEVGCKNQDRHGLNPEIKQLSTVGAVKVAVRSLSMNAGPSKS